MYANVTRSTTDPLASARTLGIALSAALAVCVGSLASFAFEMEPCDGPGEYAEYQGTVTIWTQVCTTACPGINPNCQSGCTGWSSTSYAVFSCRTAGGGGLPPTGTGGGTPSAPPTPDPSPKDGNNDGVIDCWKGAVDSTPTPPPNPPPGYRRLGSAYGGPNSGSHENDCHTGLDIPCSLGDSVYASASGYVTFAGDAGMGNGGKKVYIYSPQRDLFYESLHLNVIFPGIYQGSYVHAGDLIGFCGNSGLPSGSVTHLHLRIANDDQPINAQCPENGPLNFLDPETKMPCP